MKEKDRELYRAFESRLHWVMIVYAAILFALGIVTNSIMKLLTLRVSAVRNVARRSILKGIYKHLWSLDISVTSVCLD